MINTGIYYQNKISKYDKCVIILFAMLPILDIYCMPSFGVLSIGEIVLLGIIMTTLIKDTRITIPKEAPFLAFYCFAVITTVLSLVFYTNYSYAASAIRLFRDLVYILSFTIIFKRHFNIQFFWNIYKKIVYILGMVFLFQFVFYYITGRHITLYLPFLKLNYAETSPIVLALQRVNMNRMESIFLEPASLVAYFVPVIVMALFAFEREDYKIAIFSSIILFLAKSGTAYILLMVVWGIYFILNERFKISVKILFVPLFVIGVSVYVYATALNEGSVISRVSEIFTDASYSSGKMRILRGFMIFNQLPVINKVAGVGVGNIGTFLEQNSIHIMDTKYLEYMSSFTYILNSTGLIGICLYIVPFFKRKRLFSSTYQKVLTISVFLVLLSSFIYLNLIYVFLMTILFLNGKDDRH